ncbi:unnamed protein product, partial [Rotaria magnacalcarata]
MNFNISIQLVLHLILCDWTYYVYSASSSSAFASSVKLINRKGDSGMNSRKHKVSATNAIDIDDDI